MSKGEYLVVGGGRCTLVNSSGNFGSGSYPLRSEVGVVTSNVPLCVGGQYTSRAGGPIYGFGEARSFHGQTVHVAPAYPQPTSVTFVSYGVPNRPWQ